MVRFITYSWSSLDKLEAKLNEMEKNGFRVNHVSLGFFFSFVEKKKENDASYLVVRYYLKDSDAELSDLIRTFVCGFKGHPVKTKFTNIELWRISESITEKTLLEHFKSKRNKYSIRAVIQNLILILLFCVFFSFILLTSHAVTVRIIGAIFLGVALCFAVFYIISLIRINQAIKNTHLGNRDSS